MTRVSKWRVVVGVPGQEDAHFDVWFEGGDGMAQQIAEILSAWRRDSHGAGQSLVSLEPHQEDGWVMPSRPRHERGSN